MQHVLGLATRRVAWIWEVILAGISRAGLEGISAWSRLRVFHQQAHRFFERLLPAFLRAADRRPRDVAPEVPDAAAGRTASRRIIHLALDLALAGTTLYVVILMHRKIYTEMQVLPAYRVRLEEFQMVQRPVWAPPEGVSIQLPVDAELSQRAQGCETGLVAEVGRRLESNPWIRRVAEVRRVYPDRIEARVELRRPIACVRRGPQAAFVDRDGMRLPDLRVGAGLPAGCYEVVGVDGAAPRVGTVWNHLGVRAAIDVIESLNDYRVERVLTVSHIDVSNAGGRRDPRRSEIVCWTAAGVPVAWGRPSHTVQFGENAIDLKMKHLALALEAFPGLRNLEGIDLRFDRVVVRPRPEWQVIASAAAPAQTLR